MNKTIFSIALAMIVVFLNCHASGQNNDSFRMENMGDRKRAKLTLTSTLGVTVLTTRLEGSNGSKTIELDGLPSGVYFVNVADHTGKTCVGKIVKE